MGKGLDLDAWIAKVRPARWPSSPRVAAASPARPPWVFLQWGAFPDLPPWHPIPDATHPTAGTLADHSAIGAARVAAGVGKALKTFHHGERARSGRLDRQGATRPVAILAARGGRVPRSPTLGFSSMGRLPRSAALASHPGRDSPHSGHPRRSRTHPLTVRATTPTFHTHRSSSASHWRSPSWSPCAGTSRSYSWRRATCSR